MTRPADPADLQPLFLPRVVAAVGASSNGRGMANTFIRQLRSFGFDGSIYAVNPGGKQVPGTTTCSSLGDIPQAVDYAYVAVPANAAPAVLAGAAGNVRIAQVISSGFSETGDEELQNRLVLGAREGGVRLLGPNCLGTYSPRSRLTFIDRAPEEVGTVGIVSQSGGLAVDMIRRGKNRGLRFSGVVTVGNAADIGPAEVLRYYLDDPQTQVIGLYLEGVRDGRALFDQLMAARGVKPVVLLKGGITEQGQQAAISHTGSLMRDSRVWTGLARQCRATLVGTLDDFLDSLVALQMLARRSCGPLQKVVLFGNGGGTSVLATDAFAATGFSLPPTSEEAQSRLSALDIPPGTSLSNPIDAPAGALRAADGSVAREVLRTVAEVDEPDALVMHINLSVMVAAEGAEAPVVRKLLDALVAVTAESQVVPVLVLRSDGEADIETLKRDLSRLAHESSVPVYDEFPAAVRSLVALRNFRSALSQEGVLA